MASDMMGVVKQFVVDRFRVSINERIPHYLRDEVNEKELFIDLDHSARGLVASLYHFVHSTVESKRFEKSEIKSVDHHDEDFVPVGLWDYLKVSVGLKGRMRPVKRTTNIYITNAYSIVEKHCPHIRADRDSKQHVMYLVPPELRNDGPEHSIHLRSGQNPRLQD